MAIKNVRLAKVRRLFKLMDEGALSDDGANALSELREITEALMSSGRDVVDSWVDGDLASAVNVLREHLEYAEGKRHGV